MKRVTAIFCVACFASLVSEIASAGLFRAYLSVNGKDTNPCTVSQPCRLLPAALAAVNDLGEVWMLDSANFNTGTVTLTKSVTILAIPGALGSLVAPANADALQINAGSGSVTLRNLIVRGLDGSSGVGIELTGGTLRIENCEIFGLSVGIKVDGVSNATVVDTTIHNTSVGVNPSVAAQVAIDRLSLTNSNLGLLAQEGARVTVTNSTFVTNIIAIEADANSTTGTVVDVARSTISSPDGTGFAVSAFTGRVAEIFVHSTTIHAFFGFFFDNFGGDGQIFSYGDNRLVFYGSATSGGSLTPISGI